MKFIDTIFSALHHPKKVEMYSYLKSLPDARLEEVGFSPKLVRAGINFWPWREDNQQDKLEAIESAIAEEKRCISELMSYSDVELADIGLSRGAIRHAVRHGREGIDYAVSQRAA